MLSEQVAHFSAASAAQQQRALQARGHELPAWLCKFVLAAVLQLTARVQPQLLSCVDWRLGPS